MLNFVEFEKHDSGYWIATVELLPGMLFHVELVEVVVVGRTFLAKNSRFQDYINTWFSKNGDEQPQLFYHKKKRYFVNVEAFAK